MDYFHSFTPVTVYLNTDMSYVYPATCRVQCEVITIKKIFIFQDTNVSVATSGNNHVIICDVTGWAHLVSRSWEITSFKVYDLTVSLAAAAVSSCHMILI